MHYSARPIKTPAVVGPLEARVHLSATWTLLSESLQTAWERSTTAGNVVYFVGTDEAHGAELWRSDGTIEGTRLVRDIRPGPEGSGTHLLGALGDEAFFSADDGSNGLALWKTNGTRRGTVLVRSIAPNRDGVAYNGAFYFGSGADGPIGGPALWRTDGTKSGTKIVTRFSSSQGGYGPWEFAVIGGYFCFFTSTPGSGRNLWVSDGSSQGTRLISSSYQAQGLAGALPNIAEVGGRIVYLTSSGLSSASAASGWTEESLGAVSYPGGLANVGGRALFVGANGLWETDGTRAGTRPIDGLPFRTSQTSHVRPLGDAALVWIYKTNTTKPRELWRTDGTPAGTTRLASGGLSAFFNDLTIHGHAQDVYVFSQFGRIWWTDGTAAGTVATKLGPQDQGTPGPLSFLATPRAMFLTGSWGRLGEGTNHQLWRIDLPGAVEGVVFNDVNGNGRTEPGEGRLAGFRVYVDTNGNGRFDAGETWSRSDARGAYRLVGLNAGTRAVRVVEVAGWASPTDGSVVRLGPGDVVRRHLALGISGRISGSVFADNNRSRTWDRAEPPLPGWRVFIDADDDGLLDAGERSVVTDRLGAWSLDVPNGNVRLRVAQLANWRMTTPRVGAAIVVTLAAGQSSTGHLFGQKRIL